MDDASKRRARDLAVGELMSRRITAIEEGNSLSLAHQLMLWSGIRHLPVVRDGKLVGLVSDRDLLRFNHADLAVIRVGTAMSFPVETIDAEAPVSEASARMATGKIDCLPVLEAGHLIGILTSTDILAERGRIAHKDRTPDVPTAASVARTQPYSVGADEALSRAVGLMVEHGIRHLPVVDGDRRVIGMLSDRDVRAKVGDPRDALDEEDDRIDLALETVEDAMTRNPIQVSLGASVYDLADAFLDDRIGAVPIVDERDRLVGLVSYVDLIAFLTQR